MPVVGFLHNGTPDQSAHLVAAFHKGLSEAGHVEGRYVVIEYRWAPNELTRPQELAAELVGSPSSSRAQRMRHSRPKPATTPKSGDLPKSPVLHSGSFGADRQARF